MAGKNDTSNDRLATDKEAHAFCEGRSKQIASGALTDNPFSDLQQNIVANGVFTTDVNWTKGTGWTISGGTASSDGTQGADSDLEQTGRNIEPDESYEVIFTVSGRSAGVVTPVIGGVEGTDRSTNATFTEIIDSGTTDTKIMIRADSAFVGNVDTVIVNPLSPASSAWRRGFNDALAANPKLGCAE